MAYDAFALRSGAAVDGDAANSPLLGHVASPGLRFGLDGTARGASNDTMGAYA
jgi:hypothetical protein